MINLKDFIFTVDDLLTDEECNFIIEEFGKTEICKENSFEINSNEIKESTVDITSLVPNTKVFHLVHNKTNNLIYEYSQYLKGLDFIDLTGMMTNLAFSHNYRLMKYSEGQSIHDHIDKNPFVYGSASLALSNGYEGGLFRFFKGKHKLKTKKGQGIIWPAETYFVHGVEPVTEGVRWSVNSFLGSEECVIAENKEISGFWYHETSRSYTDIMVNNGILGGLSRWG